MSERVNARRVAIGAGVLVALYVIASFLARPVPDSLVSLLGGPSGGVDRVGGLRVHYRPPGGDVQVIEYPRIDESQVPDVIDVLVGGGLAMREVLESETMARTGIPMTEGRYPDHSAVQVDFDQWMPEEGGEGHTVGYVVGPTRDAIEAALADAGVRGWQLPSGSSIGYERAEPYPGDRDPRSYWRTYELADDVLIDGSMIANATRTFDPDTGRAMVLIDFTREGAERFCDVTRRIAGRKLATILGGRVRSAPIINGAICGGRASITMGGSDPRAQELEAAALVTVLAQGALPAGGRIESQQFLGPANVGNQEWAGRLLLGLLAGLAFGLVTFGVIRVARPTWRTPPPSVTGRFPWRRLAVTMLAPLSMIVGTWATLPGVNAIELEHIMRGNVGSRFSVIALGVMPILTTFLIVELAALAVPRWRWRRHDVRGRIGLGQAVAVLSTIVAIVQAYFVVVYLESLDRGGAEIIADSGWKLRLVAIGSLVVGTLLLGVVAGVIREHGLGNGYGALIVGGAAVAFIQPILEKPGLIRELIGSQQLVAVITAIAIAAATTCVLRWRITGGDREPALRVPLSGVSPVSDTGGLMTLVLTLSALGLGVTLYKVVPWVLELQSRFWLSFAFLVVSVPIYAWLFARPSLVERVAMQASLDRPARSSWQRALVVTAWHMIGASVLARLAPFHDGLTSALANAVMVMLSTAVVLDLLGDARAHRQKLAPVGVLHQIQYAGVVERVLADAGIPCHIHASHLRTLLAFYGPFAPAIVLVPAEHAAVALTKVDGVLRGATSKPPIARVTDSSAA